MSQNSTDCLQCRLASGGGLLGASIYIFHHARKFSNFSRYIIMGFGSGVGILGVLRILNLPPFMIKPEKKEEAKEDIAEQENYIVGKLPSKFN